MSELKKVYVVWDPHYEEVISVHKTEEGAQKYVPPDWDYEKRPQPWIDLEYDEFEVLD